MYGIAHPWFGPKQITKFTFNHTPPRKYESVKQRKVLQGKKLTPFSKPNTKVPILYPVFCILILIFETRQDRMTNKTEYEQHVTMQEEK